MFLYWSKKINPLGDNLYNASLFYRLLLLNLEAK